MNGSISINFGGRQLHLLPDRAVWCNKSTLWIADLHLGKEQTFRRSGFPVPDLLPTDLLRLTRVINVTQSKHLIILGDLLHSRSGGSDRLNSTVKEWRTGHSNIEMTLVRGNHDRHAGDPPSEWNLRCVDAPAQSGRITLTHHPLFDDASPCLAGHLHPKFKMRTRAEELKLPCFLMRRQTLVLPAFGQFIDHGVIKPEPNDDIYVIASDEVIHAKRRATSEISG
jgi:DNA ligase-associated metallophosphoesterase